MTIERHGVVRTDNMMGTRVGSHLVSLRYTADIDNGNILVVGDYEDNSREVREASIPDTATPLRQLALCASEEIVKDVPFHDIFEFYNFAGTVIRGYRLAQHDIFSVTKECLTEDSVDPEVGQYAFISNGTKIALSASQPIIGTLLGKIIQVETESNDNVFVVIEVH